MPEKELSFSTVKIIPPTNGACPVCAAVHPPEYPHNRYSLYYMMRFRRDRGRFPTMEDAMKHCGEDVRRMMRYVLSGEDA